MKTTIRLRNYRAFPEESPAVFEVSDGITAFVGPNNAGKSSLLRFFFEFRHLFELISTPTGNFLGALRGEGEQVLEFGESVRDRSEVFTNANQGDAEIEVEPHEPVPEDSNGTDPALKKLSISLHRPRTNWTAQYFDQSGNVIRPTKEQCDWFQDDSRMIFGNRGARFGNATTLFSTAASLANTVYVPSFRNAINVGGADKYFDIQVGQAFISQWSESKTGYNKAANEAAHRVTHAIQKVFGFKEFEVNSSADGRTLQLVIDEQTYRLDEVGSGLAQFILTMLNVAVKRPDFVLIDEPELGLHPTLQLDFLTSLASFSRRGLLFATHSIGLARSAADRIYTVTRTASGTSELRPYESTARLSEMLGELSYSSYRALGYESVLLVEGVTDVKTMLQFLRLYDLEHKAVLVPLGGSQLIAGGRSTELAELTRLSDRVHAVIDSERALPGQALALPRRRFAEDCKNAKIKCLVLERRALENYLTNRAVKAAFGTKYAELGHYDKPAAVEPFWGKENSWRAAREMIRGELEETDLGKFLSALAG